MPMPALLLAAALAGTSPPTMHVALMFASDTTIPAAVEEAAVHEAAAIWSEHHVVVDSAPPCASEPDEAIVLTVQPGYAPAARASVRNVQSVGNVAVALGALAFAEDGTPFSQVTVYFDRLRQAIKHERLGDVAEERWPPAMRERIVGRALGRVIAHEIGLYLLATRGHSSSGLMLRAAVRRAVCDSTRRLPALASGRTAARAAGAPISAGSTSSEG